MKHNIYYGTLGQGLVFKVFVSKALFGGFRYLVFLYSAPRPVLSLPATLFGGRSPEFPRHAVWRALSKGAACGERTCGELVESSRTAEGAGMTEWCWELLNEHHQ